MHFPTILASILLSGSTLASASGLCIQGCCGLRNKLSSTAIQLHPMAGSKAEVAAAVTVPLPAAELPCCPCQEPSSSDTADSELIHTTESAIHSIFCAEGTCYPWCTCPNVISCPPMETGCQHKPGLRPLCPKGECHPATCMCFEELLQGLHDYFFLEFANEPNKTRAHTGAEHIANLVEQHQRILAGVKSEL